MSFRASARRACKCCATAADRHGLLVVSEVMDQTQIPLLTEYADILQVGARNMQNFNLLRELGKQSKPVLLKRGIAATIEELLLSAEYILAGGNYNVILCERGIRTFETYTQNTLDLSAIPVVKKLSHLPIVADPSHGTGRRDIVAPMARAAIAAGADGLLMEVHPDPDRALSDGAQSMRPEQFEELMHATSSHRSVRVGQDSCEHAKRRHRRHRTDRLVASDWLLRKAGFTGAITGVSSPACHCGCDSPRARSIAARRSKPPCRDADLVFLSQTIGRILDTIRHLDPLLRPGALVTDAGSTKCAIVDLARAEITRAPVPGRAPHGGQGDARRRRRPTPICSAAAPGS